jgi:prevent-host-death family protein
VDPSQQIKPISYLKAHAAAVIKRLRENHETMIITQNGEATVILQDIESYVKTQQSLALLKILALGNKQIENGQTETASSLIKRLRNGKKNHK